MDQPDPWWPPVWSEYQKNSTRIRQAHIVIPTSRVTYTVHVFVDGSVLAVDDHGGHFNVPDLLTLRCKLIERHGPAFE